MKKVIWILAILAIGALAYFTFLRDKTLNFSSAYETFQKKIASLGELKKEGELALVNLGGMVGSGVSKFEEAKSFLEKTSDTVSSTIAGLKNNIPSEAIELLSKPDSLNKQKISNLIFSNGNTATSSSSDLQKEICVQFDKNSDVKYAIENPFSPQKDYSYRVDWGDGKYDSGKSIAGDGALSLSHVYARVGTYQNIFSITSASSTALDARVKVCIR